MLKVMKFYLFAKNMGKNTSKNTTKKISGGYSHNVFDTAKNIHATDAFNPIQDGGPPKKHLPP